MIRISFKAYGGGKNKLKLTIKEVRSREISDGVERETYDFEFTMDDPPLPCIITQKKYFDCHLQWPAAYP